MPTHFSKLEGSPLNVHRERRRRSQRNRVSAATTPTFSFDESFGSNATACEGDTTKRNSNNNNNNSIKMRAPSSRRRDISRDVPQSINVQNSRRLYRAQQERRQEAVQEERQKMQRRQRQPQNRLGHSIPRHTDRSPHNNNNNTERSDKRHQNRQPNYDAYCENRVSAITSSFPNHDNGPGSSRISSLSSNPRSVTSSIEEEEKGNDRYAVPPRGKQRLPPSPRRSRNTSSSVPGSDPSAPTVSSLSSFSSSGRRNTSPPALHTLVNSHGVFGSNTKSGQRERERGDNNNTNRESPTFQSSRRRHRGKDAPKDAGTPDLLIQDSYGFVSDDDDDGSLEGEGITVVWSVSEDSRDVSDTQSGRETASASVSTKRGSERRQQHDDSPPAASPPSAATKWLCDVCKEARFDSYVEAYRHEIQCRKSKQNKPQSQSHKPRETKPSRFREDAVANRESGGDLTATNRIHNNDSKKYATMIADDKGRSLRNNGIQNQLYERNLPRSFEISRPPTTHCIVVDDTSKPREREKSAVGGSGNNSMASNETTRWICSVCNEVSFENYSEACDHEKICRIRMEATADLREAAAAAAAANKPQWTGHPPPLNQTHTVKLSEIRMAPDKSKGMLGPPSSSYDDKISRIRMEATADMRGQSVVDPPVVYWAETRDDGNGCTIHVSTSHQEQRQGHDYGEYFGPPNRYDAMDIIERQREGYTDQRSDPSIAGVSNERKPVTEALDDVFRIFDEVEDDLLAHSQLPSTITRSHKGEAYDRYVSLASQQEEEEERERFIALAKQTREEELMSYTHGENDSERYVCLA